MEKYLSRGCSLLKKNSNFENTLFMVSQLLEQYTFSLFCSYYNIQKLNRDLLELSFFFLNEFLLARAFFTSKLFK